MEHISSRFVVSNAKIHLAKSLILNLLNQIVYKKESVIFQKSYSDELNKINEFSSNPYDGGNTSQKILEILKKTNFKNLKLKKKI